MVGIALRLDHPAFPAPYVHTTPGRTFPTRGGEQRPQSGPHMGILHDRGDPALVVFLPDSGRGSRPGHQAEKRASVHEEESELRRRAFLEETAAAVTSLVALG